MANIFIIHGVASTPKDNWFPWLKKELNKQGHTVFIPKFPTPIGQNPKSWFKVLKKHEKKLENNENILVGHSLGVLFGLHLLEKYKFKSAFMVAGFAEPLGNSFDLKNNPFFKKFDWTKIRQNCPKFYVFQGDNDPYVKIKVAKNLAKNLKNKIILIKNGGHLSKGTGGFTKFDRLLSSITKEIGKNPPSL